MLSSDDPSFAVYFNQPKLMLDTSAVISITQQTNSADLYRKLKAHYCLLVPTTVIYETGFGPKANISPVQKELLRELESAAYPEGPFESEEIKLALMQKNKGFTAGKLIIVNPKINEWISARNRLVSRIELSGDRYATGKKKHSLDAVIHSCARNQFAPLCTNNIADFEKFNEVARKNSHDGAIPLFTIEEAERAIEHEVIYAGYRKT